MYEQSRNEVMLGLQHLTWEQLDEFLRTMDNVASRYEMQKRTLEIAVRVNELPDCAKVYLVVKKMSGLSDTTRANYLRTISKRAHPQIGRKVTPNILRHTTATTALQRGTPVEDISKLLGHESIETTMIYAKTSLDTVQAGHRKHVV